MGAGGSAGRSTCVRVPGVVGVIEAQGGGWTNAVYKITLSGSPAHAVPYSMLSISSATRCHNGEEPKYLLDEGTRARNACGTSKWNAATRRQIPVTLEIKVRGPPIRLATYALKSANDFPGRDPKQWDLIAVCSDGSERVVHAMGNHDRKWSGPSYYPAGRWQWRQWPCIHNFEANCFRLRIHDNHGDGGCTQLGQLRLFQYLSTEDGLRRRLDMDRARVRETEARLAADRERLEAARKQVQETETRLAALLATQAEEEMPAPAKVAPEPEAEPQAEPLAEAWLREPGAEPIVEGVVVETEPGR
jgi:cell division septation protein DedD